MVEKIAVLKDKVDVACRRVRTRQMLRVSFRTLLAGSLCDFALIVVSRFVYIPYLSVILGFILVLSGMAGIFFAMRIKISPFEGAMELDALFGLKERLATAVELLESEEPEDPIHTVQLSDSARAAEMVNPYTVKIGFPKEAALFLFLLILCASVALFPPAYSADNYRFGENLIRESISLQLTKQAGGEGDREVAKALSNASNKIENGNLKEAREAVSVVRERLLQQYNEALEREKVFSEMDENPALAKVVKALQQNSPESFLNELESFSDGAGGAKTEQLLRDIANEIEEDPVFRRMVERLAEAIEKRDKEEIKELLKSFAELSGKESAKSLSEKLFRVESIEERLADISGGVVAGRSFYAGRRAGSPTSSEHSSEMEVFSPLSQEIEEAIYKQEVPERFKQIVRGYFGR